MVPVLGRSAQLNLSPPHPHCPANLSLAVRKLLKADSYVIMSSGWS